MGLFPTKHYFSPDTLPDNGSPPTFDPMYGFKDGRKLRTIKATQQEMDAAKVPLGLRDYCVDTYLELLACKGKHFPNMRKCLDLRHEQEKCRAEDYILRMKEFERERRLRIRQKKKQEAAAATA